MEEQPKTETFQTLYLILAILGVISCVPLTRLVNIGVGVVVLGLAIYLMVKLPKGKRRTGALLLVIASALAIVFWGIILATFGSLIALSDMTSEMNSLSDSQAMTLVGGALGAAAVGFASWVVRIVGVVFAFIAYGREKQLAFDGEHLD